MQRVPVLNPDGSPAMPTKASRARRWLKEGKAKVLHNDLGIFQIQLIAEPSGHNYQDVVIGIDSGKLFTGIAVQTAKSTLLMLHLVLPFKIVTDRMTTRRMMRRTRRARRVIRTICFKLRNHRQKRFSNRRQKGLPPSINANKLLEQRVITELRKIYPVSHFVYEIVKANGTKSFSPVMVGQLQQIAWLKSQLPTEVLEGWKTSILRRELGLLKNKTDKSAQEPATHAVDGVALAASHFIQYKIDRINRSANWIGDVKLNNSPFVVISRPPYSRRQLHLLQFSKGGERRAYGGSTTINNFRKGDLILYKSKDKNIVGYCSGSTGKSLSISDANWSRLGRFAASKCQILSRSCGLVVKAQTLTAIPLATIPKVSGSNLAEA
jgi:hypothetical protein